MKPAGQANRAREFERACAIAKELGRDGQEVHADMVMRRLIAEGIHPSALGNAAGSIFKGKQWEFTGKWYRSRRVSNHARWIQVWQLTPVEYLERHPFICAVCNTSFMPKRSDSRYCSSACRQNAYRRRHAEYA